MIGDSMIMVRERISDNLATRRAADELFEFVEAAPRKSVVLDFKGVTFMSRSFAHQYLLNRKSEGKKLVEKNIASVVRRMMAVVKKQGSIGYGNGAPSSLPVAAERL